MSEFRPGLEGVVAFETQIAEPDREGGALRYRGIDIEELVGTVPYEQVWGLLVDEQLQPGMADPEPYEPKFLSGNAPADLQSETARLSAEWGLGKLNEIDDDQARIDLGRLSAQMMAIVARSARVADGHHDSVPDDVVAQGQTAAEKFLLRWRGEADPRHVKAIDTYWICTAEHGLNASTFTARVVASTGADCGAALSSAVGGLSGPLHGGAPAYVIPMLDEVAALGDADKWVVDALDSQEADHGLRAPRLPRRGSALAPAQAGREGARLAARRDRRLARAGRAARAEAPLAGPRARDERRVLVGRRARHRRDPAAARARDVRVLPRRRLVGAHPRAEAHRPARAAVGDLRRPRQPLALLALVTTLAEAAVQADALAKDNDARGLADLRAQWGDELEAAARSRDFRERAVAYRAIGQFRFRQKTELLRRALEDESPACRGSGLISLELLSRDHPGDVNGVRPLLHELVNADDNDAVRRLAMVCLRNGSPQRPTIQILEAVRDDEDQGIELRRTAEAVAAELKKRLGAKG